MYDVCMYVKPPGKKRIFWAKMCNRENGVRRKSVKKHENFSIKKNLKYFFFTGVDVKTWEIVIKTWKFH